MGLRRYHAQPRVHIGTAADKDALKVDVGGQTKLLVAGNGSTSIGGTDPAPSNGLFVSGNTGLGGNPGAFKLKVFQFLFGLDIENVSNQRDWELFVLSSGLGLYADGVYVGEFNRTTGAYSSVSDERSKTSIQAMPPVLDRVKQLKPSTYQFQHDGLMSDATMSYGFIAQDVEAVFPHLVHRSYEPERDLDAYTVDYAGFGVLAIKAIQELEARVAELEKDSRSDAEKMGHF